MTQPIDSRTRAQLIEQLRQLAQTYLPHWSPPDRGHDPGSAMIELFSYMAGDLIERINQTPDKNFLAYLNLIGVEALPPRPAHVPLTFKLAEGSQQSAFVPADAQVVGLAPDGTEVIYETTAPLTLTPALLKAALVYDPINDRYTDLTARISDPNAGSSYLFLGEQGITHQLYLALDRFFTHPGPKAITLTFETPEAYLLDALPLRWSYWDGTIWAPLTVITTLDSAYTWHVAIEGCPTPAPLSLTPDAITACWIRAQLEMTLPQDEQATALLLKQSGVTLNGPFRPFNPLAPAPFLLHFAAMNADMERVLFTVTVESPGEPSEDLALRWEYWDGTTWQTIGVTTPHDPPDPGPFQFDDTSDAWTISGVISFLPPADWARQFEGGWLRVVIQAGGYGTGKAAKPPVLSSLTGEYEQRLRRLPSVERITAQLDTRAQGLAPELAVNNLSALDLEADFYPFGLEPAYNSLFYLAQSEVLAKPDAQITLTIELTNPIDQARTDPPATVRPSANLMITWEIWDGETWQTLGVSTPQYESIGTRTFDFRDGTYALTRSGRVTFITPWTVTARPVIGRENYWVRARITQGHYGSPAQLTSDAKIIAATYAPPLIRRVQFSYLHQLRAPLDQVIAYNDFVYRSYRDLPFTPFSRCADSDRAIYLAFDPNTRQGAPFGSDTPSLYWRIDSELRPQDMARLVNRSATTIPPRLIWEYSTADGWRGMRVEDGTSRFTERGLVRFAVATDFVPRRAFDRVDYWIRARWIEGEYTLDPRVRQIRLNTVWAREGQTVEREIVGSSSGEANQRFRLANPSPILEGQQLLIREDDEHDLWIEWQEVPDLYNSVHEDRHYVLSRITGEILFGDGITGMIPPYGGQNIRARYRHGVGVKGNLPAHTINQLRSAYPRVDSVDNFEAAGGGSDTESNTRLQDRGPRWLRHRDRAVAAEDFADLAREISAVKRVKVITGKPGQVGVIIVPDSADRQPIPSLGLIEQVRDQLTRRAIPTLDLWITGPDWIEIDVSVEVVPIRLDIGSALIDRVQARLEAFLHPLTGGKSGQGWAFGAIPHRSDLYALIEAIPEVDYISQLVITPGDTTAIHLDRALIFPGTLTITRG